MQKTNLRESIFQDEFVSPRITNSNAGLVIIDVLKTKFVQLLLEVVFVADGKFEVVSKRFGYFENSVTPVVCSFRVLDIVNTKICNYQRFLELS